MARIWPATQTAISAARMSAICAARRRDPLAREIVRFRQPRALDQDDDGTIVRRPVAAGEPGMGRHAADADLRGIEEIGGALDVG